MKPKTLFLLYYTSKIGRWDVTHDYDPNNSHSFPGPIHIDHIAGDITFDFSNHEKDNCTEEAFRAVADEIEKLRKTRGNKD